MAPKDKNGKSANTKKSRKKATSRARTSAQPSSGKTTASPANAVKTRQVATVAAPDTAERALETPEETATSTPPVPEGRGEVIKELMRMPKFRQMVIARLIKKLG